MFSVIHRTELAHVQQFGQLACVDAVALAAFFQQGILSRITHYEFRHVRLQQIVQPAGPSAFFKREVHISAQPVDKLQNGARFGLDDAFHHHLAGRIQNCDRNAFLMHVQADIFSASHRGCSFLVGNEPSTQNLLQRGALL
jgi:hypothetical protein